MSATTFNPVETDENLELQAEISRILSGGWDRDAARRACEEMDRDRESLQKQIGTVEVAVDLVREFRDR